MGYMTSYQLNVKDDWGVFRNEPIEDLRKTNSNASFAIDGYGETSNDTKWYKHEEDLKEFSKKYPNHLFILDGQGEESGDIWRLYVKNGQTQRAEAVITFEECKL